MCVSRGSPWLVFHVAQSTHGDSYRALGNVQGLAQLWEWRGSDSQAPVIHAGVKEEVNPSSFLVFPGARLKEGFNRACSSVPPLSVAHSLRCKYKQELEERDPAGLRDNPFLHSGRLQGWERLAEGQDAAEQYFSK